MHQVNKIIGNKDTLSAMIIIIEKNWGDRSQEESRQWGQSYEKSEVYLEHEKSRGGKSHEEI
jgi:hypothetical protein